MQELQSFWKLMINLKGGGDREEHEEPVVQKSMHDPRRRITQQGLHNHPGFIIADPSSDVRPGCRPEIGCAALPIFDTLSEIPSP